MKKYFTAIIFTLLILPVIIPAGISAQWYVQYYSGDNYITDVRFIDKNTGWACGVNRILKTTNGGLNWVLQNGYGDLSQIHPVNDSVVYACGSFIITKTTNGGTNWVTVREGAPLVRILYGLWFNDENTGWFCGDRVAMRTTNGGESFIDSMFMTTICNDIHFKDDSNGVIMAWGKAFKTTNSGSNWTPVTLPSYSVTPFAERVSFIGDTGWTVTTAGYIYRTINYGNTWDSLNLIQLGGLCIEFADHNIGYAGGYSGLVYKTTDGGINWNPTIQAGIGPFTSIFAYNDSIVWAVRGDIFNTVTGGLTEINHSNISEDKNFQLLQNYPNPFNSSTVVRFKINVYSFVSLKVFDITGKEIQVLNNGYLNPGNHKIEFDGSGLSTGVYYYSLESFDRNKRDFETKKFLLIK